MDKIDPSTIEYREKDSVKSILYITFSYITCGLLPIICRMLFPSFELLLTTSVTSNLKQASHISYNGNFYEITHMNHDETHILLVDIEYNRYAVVLPLSKNFKLLNPNPTNFERFLHPSYYKSAQVCDLQKEKAILTFQYGENSITFPSMSRLEIGLRQLFSPFYIFQYCTSILWILEGYTIYAVLILVITIITVYMGTMETIYNLQRLKEIAGRRTTIKIIDEVLTLSNDGFQYRTALDSELVPGLRFLLTPGMSLPCDAIMLAGRAVMDESMLTGESIPVSKSPIDYEDSFGVADAVPKPRTSWESYLQETKPEVESMNKYSASILYSGTSVKSCPSNGTCIAVCYRTSFRSAKGLLISSLLKPKNEIITFVSDALWVIIYMVLLTTALYIGIAVELSHMGADGLRIFFGYLDALTIAVPPALTACLTIATAISITRLKTKNIFVSETSRINFAGSVGSVCFDKTGTLTENRLKFIGATMSDNGTFREYFVSSTDEKYDHSHSITLTFLEIMATCHNLSLGGTTGDVPEGDPLEVELISACGWKLGMEHDGDNDTITTSENRFKMCALPPRSSGRNSGYKIQKHFEFTSDKLRAASLVLRPSGSLVYLMKGSPEKIFNLCDPASIPEHIDVALNNAVKKGCRVLAFAKKEISNGSDTIQPDNANLSQSQVESNGGIVFVGLVYLANALKSDTRSTINQLRKARVHVNMITGDHVGTAIAVARDCGILKKAKVYIIDGQDPSPQSCAGQSLPGLALLDYDNNTPVSNEIDIQSILRRVVASTDTVIKKHIRFEDPSDGNGIEMNPLNRFVYTDVHPHHSSCYLAVTGRGLNVLKDVVTTNTLLSIIRYARIFARTKPSDKKSIVEFLKKCKPLQIIDPECRLSTSSGNNVEDIESSQLGRNDNPSRSSNYTPISEESSQGKMTKSLLNFFDTSEEEFNSPFEVMFCGDGANDMAALRASTVGLSLCDAETSVAAPITSKNETPASVIDVLIEGRCSLITAYVLILFMVMYGYVQLFMALILYNFGLLPGTYMYLIQDLFYTLFLGIAIVQTSPATSLCQILPPKRFISQNLMIRLLAHLILFTGFQLLTIYVLTIQSFYQRYVLSKPLQDTYSYEATVAFDMCLAQLMIASIISTIGPPFRDIWFHNRYHIWLLCVQFIFLLFILFSDENTFTVDVLQIKAVPTRFGFILLALICLHASVSIIINELIERICSKLNQSQRNAKLDRLLKQIQQ